MGIAFEGFRRPGNHIVDLCRTAFNLFYGQLAGKIFIPFRLVLVDLWRSLCRRPADHLAHRELPGDQSRDGESGEKFEDGITKAQVWKYGSMEEKYKSNKSTWSLNLKTKLNN